MDDELAARRLQDTRRVEAFSDGVLAIAMTLLVLDLTTRVYRPGSFGAQLLSAWPAYVAFLSSFLYVAVMWVNHHAIFSRLTGVTTRLLWANMAVLLGAVVLAFTTAVLAQAFQDGLRADRQAAIAAYAVLMSAMCAGWAALIIVIRRTPAIWRDPDAAGFWGGLVRNSYVGIVGYLVAGLLGWVSPWIGLVLFAGFPVLYAVQARVD
jgi:uncharacterized membrane protein